MSETLNYISEFVQTKPNETIKFRDRLVSEATALGPPDLCILYKTYQGSLSTGHQDTHEYAHWVIGANNSSPESVSKYFEALLGEQPSSSWYSPGSFRILGGVYCTYDCFSGLDVRVDLNLRADSYLSPGVMAYAIDANGNRSVPTKELWKSLFVAAGLRCVAFPPSFVPCMNTMDVHLVEKHDVFYVEAGEVLQRGYPPLRGVSGESNSDVVAALMYQYLSMYARSEDIIKFFTPLVQDDPTVAGYVANAYANFDGERGVNDAVAILMRAIRKDPFSPPLLREVTKHLLTDQRPHLALPLAKTWVEQEPLKPESWITLAQVYFQLRKPSLVLVALNGMPLKYAKETDEFADLVNLPGDIPATRLTSPPAKYAYAGVHEWWFYDSERVHRENCPEEYVDSDDEEDVRAAFADKPQLKGSELDEASLKAYRILSDMEQALGWPKLVKICRKIFHMRGRSRNQRHRHDFRVPSSDSGDLQSELSQYEAEQQRSRDQEQAFIRKMAMDDSGGTLTKQMSLQELARAYQQRGNEDDGAGLGFAPAFMPLSPRPAPLVADVSLTSVTDRSPSDSPRSRAQSFADENSGFDASNDLRRVTEEDDEDPYKIIEAMKKAAIEAGDTAIQLDDDKVDLDGLGNRRFVKLNRRPGRGVPAIKAPVVSPTNVVDPVLDAPMMSARGPRPSAQQIQLELSSPRPSVTFDVESPKEMPVSPLVSPSTQRPYRSKSASSGSGRRRSSSSSKRRRPPRRTCSPWLKKLLEFLYEDLAVLYSWHRELDERRERRRQRKELREVRSKSPEDAKKKKRHHSIDIGSGDNADGSSSDSDDSSSSSSSSSSSDTDSDSQNDDGYSVTAWLAYASLARRLHRMGDAETAFREALKQDRRCISAWIGLLELYAEAGFVRPALVAAGELCNLDMKEHPHRDVAPKCVLVCLTKLLSQYGLQTVFDEYVVLPRMDGCNNYIGRLFERAKSLRIDGYNR